MLPLLERTDELDALSEAATRALSGAGSLLVVEGRPGLGKSRLADAAAATARESGLRVLTAIGDETEQQFAFGVVLQLFERAIRPDLGHGAGRLAAPLFADPSEAAAAADDERALLPLLHGLYWLTAELADEQPLLIAIDDAHWADEPSLRFIGYLAQRVADLPVVVLVLARPAEHAGSLAFTSLVAHDTAVVHELEPLTPPAIETAVRASLDVSADAAFCAACAEVTGGNPFLLAELLAEVEGEDLSPSAASVERVRELTPESLTRRVVARLASLGPDAVALADALAVLRESTPLHQAARVAGLDGASDAAYAAAEALAGIDIVTGSDRLAFTHPLVRAAVYADMRPALRVRLHRAAATVLTEDGERPERIAAQLLEASAEGDPVAVATLREAAGRATARGVPASAAAYLERAMAEPPPADERAAIARDLALAQSSAGLPAAAESFELAIGLADDDVIARSELQLARARDEFAQGRIGDAVATLEQARVDLAGADAELDVQLRAELLPLTLLYGGSAERVAAQTAELLEEVGVGPLTPVRRAALVTATLAASFGGFPRTQLGPLVRRALGNGDLLAEATADGNALYSLTFVMHGIDEYELMESVLTDAIEDAQRRGSVMAFATASYCRAAPRYLMGRLVEAIADCEAAVAAREYGWEQYRSANGAYLALCHMERGDMEAARAALDESVDTRVDGLVVSIPALQAEGRYALACGEPRRALEFFERWGAIAVWPNPGVMGDWRSHAALAHIALGENERALSLVDEEIANARATDSPRATAAAIRVRGLAEGGDDGVESLAEAARLFEQSSADLGLANTLVDLGAALRRAHRRADARVELKRGLDMAVRMGAAPLAARATEELRAAGARPRTIARRPGADSLTPSELRIARMAADGMKNREIAQALFVTVKAVEYHLANAYRKLGIARRAELGAALAGDAI